MMQRMVAMKFSILPPLAAGLYAETESKSIYFGIHLLIAVGPHVVIGTHHYRPIFLGFDQRVTH